MNYRSLCTGAEIMHFHQNIVNFKFYVGLHSFSVFSSKSHISKHFRKYWFLTPCRFGRILFWSTLMIFRILFLREIQDSCMKFWRPAPVVSSKVCFFFKEDNGRRFGGGRDSRPPKTAGFYSISGMPRFGPVVADLWSMYDPSMIHPGSYPLPPICATFLDILQGARTPAEP